MKKTILSLILLASCNSLTFGQNKATVLKILNRHYPKIQWIVQSQIKGDFDYDGTADYALRGRKDEKFVLGIVKGRLNAKSKSWILEFEEDAGKQEGLRSVKTVIVTIDDIDRDYVKFANEYLEPDYTKRLRGTPKNSKGIVISDGQCDPFHIFWDEKHKRFTWWRI